MNNRSWLIAFSLLLTAVGLPLGAAVEKPNVLFIAVDDLRPELGCYGADHVVSPNIDRLASMGTLFRRAYCNEPVCGASRASLMSGIRPTPERFTYHMSRQDVDAPHVPGLAEHFKANGYRTVSRGKVYHKQDDTEEGWSEKPWSPPLSHSHYAGEENAKLAKEKGRGPAYEALDVSDTTYKDGQTAEKAIQDLHRFRDLGEPFFLAVGFLRPHLPFNAPKKYWDLYERNEIMDTPNHFFPIDAPKEAFYNWGEMRSYQFIPREGVVESEAQRRTLRHGYYAATSYADAMVGRVIDALERLGMAENTVIVLWGDHGWQLGEHTFWCKHTNFEVAVRVPLIIRDPRRETPAELSQLVELVDLYPTLCDLAGLGLPAHLQGQSIVPLLDNPDAPGKEAVFSRHGNGESIRTDRYRYTAFYEGEAIVAEMLYDLLADPAENINIANLPAMADVVRDHRERLLKHIADRI